MQIFLHTYLLSGTILSLLVATSANAQIVPDNTLPNNTIVAPNGQIINIEGGTRAGGNLFHSFTEFNLGPGSTAFFNNAADIQNILSRVTGGNISNIDGLIKANGGANLFFINPAGIVFGPNARLNIGGSFLATSADRLIFDKGSFFSATEPNAPPLLTINVPIGLQFNGQDNGAIVVVGPGHNLSRGNDFSPSSRIPLEDLPAPASAMPATTGEQELPATLALVPIFSQLPPTGLFVEPGRTLALVGGDVVLQGGTLTAFEGRIELGSVKQGNVSINSAAVGDWNLSYEGAGQFGDILMRERSLVDASSLLGGGGAVRVRGQNIEMREIAVILIQNIGLERSGDIAIDAVESVTLSGQDATSTIRTGISIDGLGSGDNGDIEISTSRLKVADGAAISNLTFGAESATAGAGGGLHIFATDAVEAIGVSPQSPDVPTLVITGTFGAANAGNLTVSTGTLRIADGGSLTASTLGSGKGGNVSVRAAELIEISGVEPSNLLPSNLAVLSFRDGDAGSLTVDTPRLAVKGGGRVGATTGGSGSAGVLTINASESIEVSGQVPGSLNSSVIDSSATILDESVRQLFSLPPVPTGNTGEVSINTLFLRVADGALVGVQHDGTGNAGRLRINAGTVLLEGGGAIAAGSASGFGGNLSLYIGDSLLLRGGSSIAAEALGGGDGGNLTMNARTLTLLGNSNINANAFEGSGGNIRIVTEGLFPSADSAITASSQLGVDGTVEVEGLDNQASSIVLLTNNLPNLAILIANGCEEFAGSEFIITGRGGLPPTPSEAIALSSPWQDWRNSGSLSISNSPQRTSVSSGVAGIVEATGWMRLPNGKIVLVANPDPVGPYDSWYNYPHCGGKLD
ncbi:MAG: filamentous hemagglutinin N-terminal domain-containing protein [Cyanobacteriota bacterium]|nr:filamentous hemagglutinin N-terminal domain-containing protein [Cyanobacteriota bacterium]